MFTWFNQYGLGRYACYILFETKPTKNHRTLVRDHERGVVEETKYPLRPDSPSISRSSEVWSRQVVGGGGRYGGSSSSPSSPYRRCAHCAGPLSKEMETSQWTVAPFIRDSFSMIGSAVGGAASAFYGFNYTMPVVQKYVKGPIWLHFLIGAPPVIIFTSACAGLAGGGVPALAQLASSSYCAIVSSSSTSTTKKDNFHG